MIAFNTMIFSTARATNHTSESFNSDLTNYLTTTLSFIAYLTRATQDFGKFGKFDANRVLRQLSFQSLTVCAIQRPYYSISKTHSARYNRPTQARGTYLVH